MKVTDVEQTSEATELCVDTVQRVDPMNHDHRIRVTRKHDPIETRAVKAVSLRTAIPSYNRNSVGY